MNNPESVPQDVSKSRVDKYGRCIPPSVLKGRVVDADRQYHLVQPEIDYAAVLARLTQYFTPGTKFISAVEFEQRAKALIGKLSDYKQVKNLQCNVYLPLVLPQLTFADYGTALEEIFLPAVERSYTAKFPGRKFYKHLQQCKTTGQVSVVEESRHQQLIDAMCEGPVVCVFFTTPLQGFGTEVALQTIEQFPPGFALAGAIDTAVAYTAYPDTLACDRQAPMSDCFANFWQGPDSSLSFDSSADSLSFLTTIPWANGICSPGIVLFG